MFERILPLCVAAVVSLFLTVDLSAGDVRPDRILVKFKPGEAPAGDARPGGRVVKRFDALGIEVIQLDGSLPVHAALDWYRNDARVAYAQPDHVHRRQAVPNDPGAPDSGDSWHLENDGRKLGKVGADIHAQAAWEIRHDAPDVVVAVLDTGIRYTHEDLAANMWKNPNEIPGNGIDDDNDGYIDDVYGANLLNDTGEPMDDDGHGTFVAGEIGAVGNNGKGVTGVCWKVQLMAVKVLDATGGGDDASVIAGMEFARQHGAQIINASLGAVGAGNPAMSDAIDALRIQGIILVVAAGNSSLDNDFDPEVASYPATFLQSNIVSVAATNRNDLLAMFSNYGARSVDIAAPGVDVVSTAFDDDHAYDVHSGTSMAAPLTTGALALLRQQFPALSAQNLIAQLLLNVDPIPSLTGKVRSAGRLNLLRALAPATPQGPPPNDNFTRAIPLGSDIFFAGTAVANNATFELSEPLKPSALSNTPQQDVDSLWWTWTAPFTEAVTIEAIADEIRSRTPVLDVFQGLTLNGLNRIATNDHAGGASSSLSFSVTAGQRYYIRLSAAAGEGSPVGFTGKYDLVPDGFGIYTILSLDSEGPGTIAPASLVGDTLQKKGAMVTLKARPAPGYILYGWFDLSKSGDDAILSRNPSFPFRLPDTGVTAIRALFTPNPFRDLAGHYSGVFSGSDPAKPPGFLTLDLGAGGAYTASVRFRNSVWSFKGTLRSDMKLPLTIKNAAGEVLDLDLELTEERQITGTVSDSTDDFDLVAESGNFSATTNPAFAAGSYTVNLAALNPTAGTPGGIGYGTVTVSTAGAVRFAGALGDGKPVTQGTTLYRSGYWAFFAQPYAKGGANGSWIGGNVLFDDIQPGSDCAGVLSWGKAKLPREKVYPEGFQTQVQLTGARWVADPSVFAELFGSGANSVNLHVENGGGPSQDFPLTFGSKGQITAPNNAVKGTVAIKTGLFSGTFADAAGGVRAFKGALLMKPVSGGGVFLRVNQTGSVRMSLVP